MLSPRQLASSFISALDRELGWKALEARQAKAMASLMSRAEPDAFPEGLLPITQGPRRRRGLFGWLRLAAACIILAHAWFLLSAGLCIIAFGRADPAATVLMAYRKWGYGWSISRPLPLPLKKVPAHVRSMLIAVEDGKFYAHGGIDMDAFKRAREVNVRAGRILYGGSTITMQVARTLFLVPVKSYFRKYLEVLIAFELETLLSKQRILELYFGYAEWGKGVFGVERASRAYYRAGISSLSRDKAARLVALLSSPILYTPLSVEKSGILRERYKYLSRRFDPDSPFADPVPAPADAPADAALADSPADAPADTPAAPPESG